MSKHLAHPLIRQENELIASQTSDHNEYSMKHSETNGSD